MAQAVWAVLALRGPQSAGELKTRTARYHPFDDPAEVEAVLQRLAGRETPLVTNVGRRPGQSQDRWIQLLGPVGDGDQVAEPPAAAPAPAPAPDGMASPPPVAPPTAPAGAEPPGRQELEARLAAVERRLATLERELGLDSD